MVRRSLLAGALPLLSGCVSPLSAFNALAPRDRGVRRVARDIAYGDGARRVLDVYAPQDAADAPVMVFFYGGGWSSGDKDQYAFAATALAAQGFLTIIPDFRLVPETRFPGFLEDSAAAVRWAQDHAREYGGDPDRIVLSGHSSGAYSAIMLALDARYLRDAGADIAPIRGAIGLAGPYDFYPFDVESSRAAFGHAPDPQQTQPVRFARADAPPLFLAWGEQDDLVGRRNIVNLARAMQSAGGEVETKLYPELDHADIVLALSRPLRGKAPVLADLSDFARRVSG